MLPVSKRPGLFIIDRIGLLAAGDVLHALESNAAGDAGELVEDVELRRSVEIALILARQIPVVRLAERGDQGGDAVALNLPALEVRQRAVDELAQIDRAAAGPRRDRQVGYRRDRHGAGAWIDVVDLDPAGVDFDGDGIGGVADHGQQPPVEGRRDGRRDAIFQQLDARQIIADRRPSVLRHAAAHPSAHRVEQHLQPGLCHNSNLFNDANLRFGSGFIVVGQTSCLPDPDNQCFRRNGRQECLPA